jgi:signal transduction histidine kinase/ligand-binding sensor domain-containing protein
MPIMKWHARRLITFAISLMVLIAAIPTPVAIAQGPVLRFENISLRQGLSQSSVYGIVQDQLGFLWFGTEGGLNKYDGYSFTIFKHDPDDSSTLSSNVIWTLYVDRQGNLWVGTSTGLDRFERATNTFIHYGGEASTQGGLSGTGAWGLMQDSQGMLWVGTDDGGLNAFDPVSGVFTYYRHDPTDPDSISSNSVKSILEDSQGTLWVGTESGLDRFLPASGKFEHFPIRQLNRGNPSSSLILSLYEDQSGFLWAGFNGEGLGRFNLQTETWTLYRNNPDDLYSLSSDIVWAVTEDRAGRMWVGTDGGGLNLLDRSQYRFYAYRHDSGNPESLSHDAVRTLFQDDSGVFWVGTYGGGLSKSTHNTLKFALYRAEGEQPTGFSDNYIWSIAEDRYGVMWLGTFQGGLIRFDRTTGEAKAYRHDPRDSSSLSSDDVRAVLIDREGNIWVGTGAAGLNLFDPESERFSHFNHDPGDPDSLISDQIRALYEDNSGNLWIGTYSDGLNRFERDSGTFVHYRNKPGDPNSLISNRVRSLMQDSLGKLWIGTSGGISVLDPETDQITNFQPQEGNPDALTTGAVFDLYEDPQGLVWIATFGGGLNRYDPRSQTFKHYTEADGLPHNQVYSILADEQGHLWLSTNNGLSKFDPSSATFRNFGLQDGLGATEFNLGAAFKSPSGEMFFGNISGLNAFYPQEVQDSLYQPPIVVSAFQIFNQTKQTDLIPGTEINLSYQENFFSFDFAALDYTAPEKNHYAYMLEGFDKDWVDAGTRRYVSYTNLDGGKYVFRVRGTNSDGVWSEAITSIPITIVPPIWQTSWFIALMISAVIGSTAGVFWLRARNYRLQKEKLEALVTLRTTEIERRRRAAESLRDTLGALNSNLQLGEILDFITSQTARLLSCNAVAIYRLDREHNILRAQATQGLDLEWLHKISIPLGLGPTGKAAMDKEVVTLTDSEPVLKRVLEEEVSLREEVGAYADLYHSILSAPLLVQEDLYGSLTLYYHEQRSFSEEDIELAAMVAQQIALALETARLRDQAGQLAVTAERSRLARELHDAVTQTLFSSSLLAEVLPKIWEKNPEEARRRLEELRQLNRAALAEMRTLLLELRPAALVDADMSELFRHLADAFAGRTRIETQLEMDVHPEAGRDLNPDLKIALYRIAQEALNNIFKHARAEHMHMRVACQPGLIHLEIQDDGRGFDPQEMGSDHFGLRNMRERAESVGAELEVESQPGSGTRIAVTWQDYDAA